MKKNFWIAMALLSLGVTSCKDDVVFDQASYDEYLRKSFVIENVDPNHQWATVGVANASIHLRVAVSTKPGVKREYSGCSEDDRCNCEFFIHNSLSFV